MAEAENIKIEENIGTVPEAIEICLRKKIKVNPEKQKIFIAKYENDDFLALFITSNENYKIIWLHVSIGTEAEKPNLSDIIEALKKIQKTLLKKYSNAEKIKIRITDNNKGIIERATRMAGFSINKREEKGIIIFEKDISNIPKNNILKEIPEKNSAKPQPSQKLAEVLEEKLPEKTEPPPIKTIIIPQNVMAKKEEPKTIQQKINEACKKFNLTELQKTILEALMKEPLTEADIRKNQTLIKGDIKGQLLFLQQINLINRHVWGKYKLNF